VRIFLAALATGASVNGAAKVAGLSQRRIIRWAAFNGFLPAVQDAQRKGQTAKRDPLGKAAFDASIDLTIALRNRDLQRSADRYAGGDRDRLHEMWMSGELMAIYNREVIADLRRHGKDDLANHYERAIAEAPPPQPADYVGEALRGVGLERPPAGQCQDWSGVERRSETVPLAVFANNNSTSKCFPNGPIVSDHSKR